MGWNMPRWKELPGSLDERVRQLVVQLRRLKDHSGLSLSSLQAKTGYGRSSWERYLNGKALPPREAVERLARVGGVDPARLLALHEVAEEAWKARDAGRADLAEQALAQSEFEPVSLAADPVAHPVAEDSVAAGRAVDVPEPKRSRRAQLIGVCTAVVLAGVLAGLLVAAPWKDQDTGHRGGATAAPAPSASSRGAFAYRPGKTYPCTVRRQGGELSAGYSSTRTALLSGPGWDVVEAQCLLGYHGFDPGGADGVIGPNTTRAVKRLQEKAGLSPDGIVGKDTWRVLRT